MPTPLDQSLRNLETKVGELKTVKESLIAFLQGLGPLLLAAKNSPAKIEEIVGLIDGHSTDIATEVAKHTVAEDEPEPTV